MESCGEQLHQRAMRRTETAMKMAIATALVLCGLLVAQVAQAKESDNQPPHWAIVVTIIDRNTGKTLRQGKLGGPELEFERVAHCKSILERIKMLDSEQLTTVLTCQKEAPEARVRSSSALKARTTAAICSRAIRMRSGSRSSKNSSEMALTGARSRSRIFARRLRLVDL